MAKSPQRSWKVWNSKFGEMNRLPTIIEGFHDDQDIADKSADYFANSCRQF